MKIQFCGAARHVTGSAHLITLDNGFKILLDCGLYQGHDREMKDFNENWFFKPAEIDCLILSHAHIDHTGRVPKLVKDGFRGPVHSTHATRSLSAIMLLDSAFIQEKDAEWHNKKQLKKHGKSAQLMEPLYTERDVHQAMKLFECHAYDTWVRIHPDVDIQFRDAGHILGSASVALRIREHGAEKLIGFSGDIGRPNRPILRDPQPMPEVDFLICESTYGDKEHEGAPAESSRFLEIIKRTVVEKKGKLIIPAFSVGRTQEIVYLLDQMETAGVLPKKVPVYVDSPLAVNATTVFGTHPECYDNELHKYLLMDDNPFGFNELTYIRDVEVSKSLNDTNEPCIIISSSGMMNAGRVRHHLYNSIEHPKNTLLIVGYCAPNTPGGMLRNGVKTLKLFGEEKVVRMDIEVMDSFSAHADRTELYDFMKNQKDRVQKVFLVHGEIDRMTRFREYLAPKGFGNVVAPTLGETVRI
ncbi:MAG: MBL fold metallo-hydrolase [Bacteroidetes bacterium]|nr:MAG: MBL fold metallo-hydrolase [Bacteroidota bacterium]